MISERDMMHGWDYNGQDVSGWLMSEKLNGCRAYWDGATMWSRGGKVINIPAEMRAALPADMHLDGEIHAGRGGFEVARQAVQYGRFTPECQFSAFDVPSLKDFDFVSRYVFLAQVLPDDGVVNYAKHGCCIHLAHAVDWMLCIQDEGGEGVVLRDPANMYAPVRTREVLKLKLDPR